MNPQASRRVNVVFVCRQGHEHPLCIPTQHPGLSPKLQCHQPSVAVSEGSGCALPPDLESQVARTLRNSMQEWLRVGHVVIRDI